MLNSAACSESCSHVEHGGTSGVVSVIRSGLATHFESIHQPGTELVIWERRLPAALSAWLRGLSPDKFPNARFLLEASQTPIALAEAYKEAGSPHGEGRDLLTEDVSFLVHTFAAAFKRDLVDIRLETIVGRGCWKFHRDCVPARMITTYRGATTQWVDPKHSVQALREQRSYTGELHKFKQSSVALFRGSTSGEGMGIVHRSPPATARRPRFLVCLNLPSLASPERWG